MLRDLHAKRLLRAVKKGSLLALLLPSIALAQSTNQLLNAQPMPSTSFGQTIEQGLYIFGAALGLPTVDVTGMVTRLVRTLLSFIGIILLVMIIYGGLRWMVAGGDEEKVTMAKQTIANAIIGIVVIVLSYSLVSYLLQLLTPAVTPGL